MTAGSIVPHARKEVTNWEDHGPHSRDVQHTESEDSVMPQASSQKEARGVAPPTPPHKGEAQRQQAFSPKVCCKNVAFGNLTRSFKRGQI